jgi:hypothetical protein
MTDYCTVADVTARLGGQYDTDWDVAAQITICSAAIDRMVSGGGTREPLARTFGVADTETTRTFRAHRDRAGYVVVDDLLSYSTLEYRSSKAAAWSTATITYLDDHPAGVTPITAVGGGVWGRNALVRITGVFGYSLTVPDPIKEACIEYVIASLKAADAAYQSATAAPEIGQLVYRDVLPKHARDLLRSYTRVVVPR